jgi:trigger factor
MQITEKSTDGLKRELHVVIGAGEMGQRFDQRLAEIKDSVQLKGFRKGKVPEGHLRKLYGRSVMAEIVQQTVDETTRRALSDRNERPAYQPKIDLPQDEAEIEQVLAGKSDLTFDMSFEVLPDIAITDLSKLKLTRLVADVTDGAVDESLQRLAERNVRYVPEEARAAETGDRLTIDFVGKIDGEPFENGSGEGAQLVLGQGQFIAGFEDGLTGAKAGESRVVTANFPEDYPVETLKGKVAQFDVKVGEVARPEKPEINDEFASGLGAESLERLKEMVRAQIAREYNQLSRDKLKRALLDELDKTHTFELPPTLVEGEFEGIWKQVTDSLQRSGKTFADEGKTEEQAREEYRKIAERRVRLGLVIGEIGDKNKIQVTQEELRAALIEQARRFRGNEKMVYDYYQKNPAALAELRAPIFEDKVIDYIVELAKPDERRVDKAELTKPDEEMTA